MVDLLRRETAALPQVSAADGDATDAGVESLLRAAGFSDVRTEGTTYDVPFRDVARRSLL